MPKTGQARSQAQPAEQQPCAINLCGSPTLRLNRCVFSGPRPNVVMATEPTIMQVYAMTLLRGHAVRLITNTQCASCKRLAVFGLVSRCNHCAVVAPLQFARTMTKRATPHGLVVLRAPCHGLRQCDWFISETFATRLCMLFLSLPLDLFFWNFLSGSLAVCFLIQSPVKCRWAVTQSQTEFLTWNAVP